MLLNNVTRYSDNLDCWQRSLSFGNTIHFVPPRSGKKHNLLPILKKRLATDYHMNPLQLLSMQSSTPHVKNKLAALSKLMR